MKRWPMREVTRHKSADRTLGDKVHRATLHTVTRRRDCVAEMPDWEALRHRAREVRLHALDRHDELLAAFEAELGRRGVTVHRASTAEQAAAAICRLVSQSGPRVIKSKSMTSEEVHLNAALEAAGAEVTETDLGELIVQLAGEPPSHVTAPAIHLSTEDIAQLFHRELGMAIPAWALRDEPAETSERRRLARELSLAARAHLRERFLKADVGISGANFLIAETGTVVLVENECNILLTTSLPKRHIVLAGVDKLIEREEDLAVLLPLLPVAATAQRQSCYVSLLADGHPDMHVVLLDGGRGELRRDPELRDLLCCIRCGACLNACPVYRTVGGHAYGGAYAGPIGALLLPNLHGSERYAELPFASSLCGACAEACPVRIPLHDHLLTMRSRLVAGGAPDALELPLRAASFMMGSARAMAVGSRCYPWARRLAALSGPGRAWVQDRDLPPSPRETFRSWWRQHRARVDPLPPPSSARAQTDRNADDEPAGGLEERGRSSSAKPLERRFAERFAELGPDGETALHRFDEASSALRWLQQRIDEHPADAVLIEGRRSTKREYALGISSAALLIADTGGVMLNLPTRTASRVASLSETHLVVARADRLVRSVPDALAARHQRREAGRWGDVQVLVTGPSRTADVEKVLVIPAHGPRRLEVVLCRDEVDLRQLRLDASAG